MIKCCYVYALVVLASFSFTADCLAHKITVFAYVDQNMVKTESKFSGGRAAQHCQLSRITGGASVLIGETDEQGMFDFPVPTPKEGFELIVTCGDGHQGKWRIEADELLGTVSTPSHTEVSPPSSPLPSATSDIRLILREELATELGSIKRQLAELQQDKVSFADIMGGLGYFLGLAGLASYMRFRKESQ